MTVTKELALKMKAAGAEQNSHYYWIEYDFGWDLILEWISRNRIGQRVSAFNATEIFNMLPDTIGTDKKYKLTMTKTHVMYTNNGKHCPLFPIESTLEEALGEMFCQLKKETVI